MHDWDHAPLPTLAAAEILRILADGPMPSTALRRRVVDAGHSATAARLALADLRASGAVIVARHGSRTSPFTATLAAIVEQPA